MRIRVLALATLVGVFAVEEGRSAPISIEGALGAVLNDQGGGVYSGTKLGAQFSGSIDDVTFSGQVNGGGTITTFGCCIAANGLGLFDDQAIDGATAALLNQLTGTTFFAAGQVYDSVNLEGDAMTAGGGRIEIGVTYILDAAAFSGTSAGNYPFDPSLVRAALFFVFEEDSSSNDIYEAVGLLTAVPEPSLATLGLTCAAFAALLQRRD